MPSYFKPTYAEHRAQFVKAAAERRAHLETYPLAARGPGEAPLTIDAAWLGAKHPTRVLFLLSGVHGVEGYAGSAIQAQFLTEDLDTLHLPDDGAVLVVHAANPFGFAWTRRVNESNVDINRNFLDHTTNTIRRPEYMRWDHVINPTEMRDDDDARFLWEATKIIEELGFPRTQAVVSEGQYEQPRGLSYGGAREEESARILRQIVRERAAGVEELHLIDFHTGLGEPGRYTMLSDHAPDTRAHARLEAAYPPGRVECPLGGGSISAALSGESGTGMAAEVPHVFFWGGGCEFGTVEPLQVFRALRRENWCWHHGVREGAARKPFAQDLLDAFRPDSGEWRADVLADGRGAIQSGWTALFGPA